MKKLTKQQAIELLGDYAFNQRTGNEISARIEALIEFSKKHSNVEVVVNNNWSNAPRSTTHPHSLRIGGTTYRYQVWAIAK